MKIRRPARAGTSAAPHVAQPIPNAIATATANALLVLVCVASPALQAAPSAETAPVTSAPPHDAPPATQQPEQPKQQPEQQPDDLEQSRREADAAYAQAMQALQQQQWAEAELLLERALMFYPGHAEALLQLAMLLAQRDDSASAQALIQVLLDDPATPPQHRQRLQALLDSARPASQTALAAQLLFTMPPRTVIGWGLGYSSNPLAATDARQLVLTLPQGNLILPLEQRSNAGATGQVQLYHRFGQGLELQAATQASTASGAHTGKRLTLMAPLAHALQRPWYASVSVQHALDGSRRNAANLHWQATRSPQSPAQEQPALYSLGYFDEPRSSRSGWTLRAQKNLPATAMGVSSLAWAEYEHARGPSPNAVRLGLQGQWPLATGWQLHGYAYAQADNTGYSPLLDNNKPRRVVTSYLALERQITPSLWGGQLGVTLHWSRRWSNLPLFAWKDQGISLNWQRQWR